MRNGTGHSSDAVLSAAAGARLSAASEKPSASDPPNGAIAQKVASGAKIADARAKEQTVVRAEANVGRSGSAELIQVRLHWQYFAPRSLTGG